METIMKLLSGIQEFVWGPPTLILLMGTGLYFTLKLHFLQIVRFPRALKAMFEKSEGSGDVSAFGTLCTTLAADIGTGSIVGVATALRVGGPGAIFWMWVSALLGMTTKYAESVLAVKYRTVDENGQMAGGPMFYIQNGMGRKFIWLAKLFAVFGIFTAMLGCGTFPQVNAITESIQFAFGVPAVAVGFVVAGLTAVVILGGIRSISRVAELVVPVMALTYLGCSLTVLAVNHAAVPAAFAQILTGAFSSRSVAGGVSGVLVMTAIRTGVARGVYTNEAGLGSSPIVAAAAKTDSCVKQGLLSMTSVFFTTLVTCTMTGLVIISSGLLWDSSVDGSLLASQAFGNALPGNVGVWLISVSILFFSFTTILGWNYYGERCLVYLTGSTKGITLYKVIYVLALALAPFLSLEPIWLLADITNALMIIPNLVALLGLRKVVIAETRAFFHAE